MMQGADKFSGLTKVGMQPSISNEKKAFVGALYGKTSCSSQGWKIQKEEHTCQKDTTNWR